MARHYSLEVDSTGRWAGQPYAIGAALTNGGRPEDMKPSSIKRLQYERLYFNSVHYQGASKSKIIDDVCAIFEKLKQFPSYLIQDADIRNACDSLEKPKSFLDDRHEFEKKTLTTFILGSIFRWLFQNILQKS